MTGSVVALYNGGMIGGFSLTKLLFTVLAIAVVWYGFKWVGRVQARRAAGAADRAANRRSEAPSAGAAAPVEDMVKCPACGDYVAARGATHCGRADCPFPG